MLKNWFNWGGNSISFCIVWIEYSTYLQDRNGLICDFTSSFNAQHPKQ